MTCVFDTELTQFDDWIQQAYTLSHDMSNELPVRAVFGLLGGSEEPMVSFLKQQQQFNIEDQIWVKCVQAQVKFLTQK